MTVFDSATFRPIAAWPGPRTRTPRRSPFAASWSSTTEILGRELRQLGARRLVVEVDCPESQIRVDGQPRADARFRTPGVILSFESRHGPLRYACDAFDRYRDNVRALALGLEALRRVERYGIASRGEQYTGWKQLPSGIAMGPAAMSVEEAAAFVAAESIESPLSGRPCFTRDEVLADEGKARAAYRLAARRLHPDNGGSVEEFQKLEEAKGVLDRARENR